MPEAEDYLAKAEESLASAEDDYTKERHNSCARSTYYALFQIAAAALLHEGVRPRREWRHDFVQAQFSGLLVYRRKLYPASYRGILRLAMGTRLKADYSAEMVQRRQVTANLEGARGLIQLVRQRINGYTR